VWFKSVLGKETYRRVRGPGLLSVRVTFSRPSSLWSTPYCIEATLEPVWQVTGLNLEELNLLLLHAEQHFMGRFTRRLPRLLRALIMKGNPRLTVPKTHQPIHI
jgi:hypothetical protein